MRNKILYWTFKIPSILLLVVPLILSIPGFLLHLISEEFDGETFSDKINKDINENY